MFSKIEMNAHCEIHTLQILDNIKIFHLKKHTPLVWPVQLSKLYKHMLQLEIRNMLHELLKK